jgi:hypothetical protein
MNPEHQEFIEYIKAWSLIITPAVTLIMSTYLAYRLQMTHRLVNSQMEQFKTALAELQEERAKESYHAGEQAVRDRTRATVAVAAGAVTAAGNATQAAGQAVVAAASMNPAPFTPENNPGRRATDPPREPPREA